MTIFLFLVVAMLELAGKTILFYSHHMITPYIRDSNQNWLRHTMTSRWMMMLSKRKQVMGLRARLMAVMENGCFISLCMSISIFKNLISSMSITIRSCILSIMLYWFHSLCITNHHHGSTLSVMKHFLASNCLHVFNAKLQNRETWDIFLSHYD